MLFHLGLNTCVSFSVTSYRWLTICVSILKHKDILNLLDAGLEEMVVIGNHHAYLFFLDWLPHSFTSAEKSSNSCKKKVSFDYRLVLTAWRHFLWLIFVALTNRNSFSLYFLSPSLATNSVSFVSGLGCLSFGMIVLANVALNACRGDHDLVRAFQCHWLW